MKSLKSIALGTALAVFIGAGATVIPAAPAEAKTTVIISINGGPVWKKRRHHGCGWVWKKHRHTRHSPWHRHRVRVCW